MQKINIEEKHLKFVQIKFLAMHISTIMFDIFAEDNLLISSWNMILIS